MQVTSTNTEDAGRLEQIDVINGSKRCHGCPERKNFIFHCRWPKFDRSGGITTSRWRWSIRDRAVPIHCAAWSESAT